MELAVGSLVDGKVTGITKFGAFVDLSEGKTGMVHISEVAHSYVSDIHEHLTEGQMVRVKVIGIDEAGRINLSIKRTQERKPAPYERRRAMPPRESRRDAPQTFEDKLKSFMQDSESRMADIKHQMDKRGGGRSRK